MNGKLTGLIVGTGVVVVVVGAAMVAYLTAGRRVEEGASAAGNGQGAVAMTEGAALQEVGGVGKFTVSTATTGITSPVRGDGTVDYVSASNERYGKGVTPENNAFTGWLNVMGAGQRMLGTMTASQIVQMCGAEPGKGPTAMNYLEFLKRKGMDQTTVDAAADEEVNAQRRLWKEGDFPILAEYLGEQGKWLDAMAGAWGRPRYWMPFVASDGRSMVSVLLPSLGIMRSTANALAERATFREAHGDFAGFLSDVMTIKRMARHLGGGATIIERLVGVAMNNMADQAIGAVAGAGVLLKEQCVELGKALGGLAPIDPMWNAVDVQERWEELDIVLMTATGAMENSELVKNDKDLAPLPTIDAGAVDWDAVLRRFNEIDDAMVAAMKVPGRAASVAAYRVVEKEYKKGSGGRNTDLTKENGETREAYTERVGRWMEAAFLPSVSKAGELWQVSVMMDGMARAVVAAAAVKAETNKWPETLEGLAPGYLEKVPVDVYSMGETDAVKYVRGEGGGEGFIPWGGTRRTMAERRGRMISWWGGERGKR